MKNNKKKSESGHCNHNFLEQKLNVHSITHLIFSHLQGVQWLNRKIILGNNLYYRNSKDTPTTVMIAPIISLGLIFSLNSIIDGAMINTGTIPMIVDATPVVVN